MNNLNNNVTLLDIVDNSKELTQTIFNSPFTSAIACKTANVVKVGQIHDRDCVLSGFTNTNDYATVPTLFQPGNLPFEIGMKFKCYSVPNGQYEYTRLFAPTQDQSSLTITVWKINSTDMKVNVHATHTNGAWDIISGNLDGSFSYKINEWIWFKFKYTGTAYELYCSKNGTDFTKCWSVISDKVINTESTPFRLGTGSAPFYAPLDGEIDLNECYININGNRWWNGTNIGDSVVVQDPKFIPHDTVIRVELDGSGDFTNVNDAFNYLDGKYSNGYVTIKIGEGEFPLTSHQFGTWKFGIPYLNIFGSGMNKTTLYDSTTGNDSILKFQDCSTYFQIADIHFRCSTTDPIPLWFYNAHACVGNIKATNCRVVVDSCHSDIIIEHEFDVNNCIHQAFSSYYVSTLLISNPTINCNSVSTVFYITGNSRAGGEATITGSYNNLKVVQDISTLQGV